MTTFIVCCTGRSAWPHGLIELGRLEQDETGNLSPVLVAEQSGKPRPGSWHHSAFGRRERAAHPEFYEDVKAVARQIRDDYAGRVRWRFPECPKCGSELPPQSDDRMKKHLSRLAAVGRCVLRITDVPRE